ncbi:MAG: E3 binding domain-containing protein, partial [Candidatus Eremiobacteraeota bacterium]|nr:E3 binding domain-containing protein [Candidatus Eremiobacteraeota bacterium]
MATTITMPQLGETVTEGTVAQWLKRVGDSVDKYEPFVEVSTDKVNAEVPSPVTGVIREVLVKEGETVATGTPIAVIDEAGAAAAPAPAAPAPHAAAATAPAHAAPVAAPPAPAAPASTNGAGASGGRIADADAESVLRGASPAVRRLAREHHIDIRTVKGTGTNGRVTADDVLTAARMGPSAAVAQAIATGAAGAPPATPAAPKAPPPSGTSTYGEPIAGTTIPLTQARRIIAERMV